MYFVSCIFNRCILYPVYLIYVILHKIFPEKGGGGETSKDKFHSKSVNLFCSLPLPPWNNFAPLYKTLDHPFLVKNSCLSPLDQMVRIGSLILWGVIATQIAEPTGPYYPHLHLYTGCQEKNLTK